jgi:hypothetical protein
VIATASGDLTRKRTAGFWAFWTALIALAVLIGALAGIAPAIIRDSSRQDLHRADAIVVF